MALPQTNNPASPADSDSPSQGASQIRGIKQYLVDVFGTPNNTAVTAAPFSFGSTGLLTINVAPFVVPCVLAGSPSQILRISSQYSSIGFDINGASVMSLGATGLLMQKQFLEWAGAATAMLGTQGSAPLVFRTNSVNRVTVDSGGVVMAGTAVSTGATAGDIVVPYNSHHRGVNAGGTSASYVSPYILTRTTTTVSVSNTVTETTIFNFTIPANILSTNRSLRLTLFCTVSTTGNPTLTIRTKFGSAAITPTNAVAMAAGLSSVPMIITFYVNETASTAVQTLFSTVEGNSNNGTALYNISTGLTMTAASGTGLIDTTTDQTLSATVEWGTASASNGFGMNFGFLELIPS